MAVITIECAEQQCARLDTNRHRCRIEIEKNTFVNPECVGEKEDRFYQDCCGESMRTVRFRIVKDKKDKIKKLPDTIEILNKHSVHIVKKIEVGDVLLARVHKDPASIRNCHRADEIQGRWILLFQRYADSSPYEQLVRYAMSIDYTNIRMDLPVYRIASGVSYESFMGMNLTTWLRDNDLCLTDEGLFPLGMEIEQEQEKPVRRVIRRSQSE